jgi:hypothetical protein
MAAGWDAVRNFVNRLYCMTLRHLGRGVGKNFKILKILRDADVTVRVCEPRGEAQRGAGGVRCTKP